LRIHSKDPYDNNNNQNTKATMAVGPLARIIAQVIVPVVAVLARALPAAYAQALQNAKKSGAATTTSTESMQQMLRKTITRQESLQILHLNEETATAEAIQKVCFWI
jgi:import inner membrane translocase subunit TIM16